MPKSKDIIVKVIAYIICMIQNDIGNFKNQNNIHKHNILKPKTFGKNKIVDIEYDTEEVVDEHFFDISDDSDHEVKDHVWI